MKVLLATGGTGGHIFPALQTALELKRRGHEVSFAGVLGIAQAKIEAAGFKCRNIQAKGWSDRSLAGAARFALSMTKACMQAMRIVGEAAPDKVVGFGGYGSFPVVLAAKLKRRVVMIHEQNVVPGKANRVLAKLSGKVAVSFRNSAGYFGAKAVWTGCPCHNRPASRSREDICRTFGLNPHVKIVALLGGSQGSQKLNDIFFRTITAMPVQAVHMTGKNEHGMYVEKYKTAAFPAAVSAFIDPIEELYAVADVIVARCGAATISELGAFSVPSVLVPYPLADNHQKYNACVLSDAGAGILLEQKDLDELTLRQAIERCGTEEFSRRRVAQKTEGLFIKDAAKRLADAVEKP